ncbi:MAG TPA: XRE family transcriptional regulator [Ramlibacter sp.]|jgi:transcriptional regulator with XRE-family HTH domain|uniref:helix-turn-helix domain-containing protein n=1 Tax=Ramlibacter sp. TaxID=1917967 RepID=UPI002D3FCB04|nr:XRE family transcriptional regulator [Ramlibacter sp.]HZY17734.1 XRE family transcriptional regulator [Ramlibacter sp.]
MDLNGRIGQRIRELRAAQALSLDALADRSGVSRSNISLIERGESSATAVVLDKITAALGVPLASLFQPGEGAEPPSPMAGHDEQPVWRDPATSYTRRHLSPAVESPLQLVEVRFPAGQRVAMETGPRPTDIHQQLWLLDGRMEITVGDRLWRLQAGDCLAMRLQQPIVFHNPGRREARYLVALVTAPARA